MAAVRLGVCDDLRCIPWDGTPFYAPKFPGSNEIDEGSPFLHWYDFEVDGRVSSGFLVCWPEGARLRAQTHENGKAVTVDHVWTWWLDPAISFVMHIEEREAA